MFLCKISKSVHIRVKALTIERDFPSERYSLKECKNWRPMSLTQNLYLHLSIYKYTPGMKH